MHLSLFFIPGLIASGTRASVSKVADVKLRDLVKPAVRDSSPILVKALEVIDRYQTGPTCGRLAAATLLGSCKNTNDPFIIDDHGAFDSVDEIKTTAAVRLTLCEMQGGRLTIPESCQLLLPTRIIPKLKLSCRLPGARCGPATDGHLSYEIIPQAVVHECLADIAQESGRGWSSYSNALQSVHWMCHIVRHEVEKDETLDLFRNLVNVSKHVQDVSAGASQNLTSLIHELSRSAQQTADLHDLFQKDIENGHREVKSVLAALSAEVSENIRSAFTSSQVEIMNNTKRIVTEQDYAISQAKDIAEVFDLIFGRHFKFHAETTEKQDLLTAKLDKNIAQTDQLDVAMKQVMDIATDNNIGLEDVFAKMAGSANAIVVQHAALANYTESSTVAVGRLREAIDENNQRIARANRTDIYGQVTNAAIIYGVVCTLAGVRVAGLVAGIFLTATLTVANFDFEAFCRVLDFFSVNKTIITSGLLIGFMAVTVGATVLAAVARPRRGGAIAI